MKEIKFRAWNKADKTMSSVPGLLNDGRVIQFSCGMLEAFSGYEIMQYTGLKDKNGKEIYEGDIIEYNNDDYMRTGGYFDDEIKKSAVKYENGAYWVDNNLLTDVLLNDEEAEIVGNVFENYELLDGEE